MLPGGSLTPLHLSWTEEGTIVFADGDAGVFQVADTGGEAELVFTADAPILRPSMLPGGHGVLGTDASSIGTVLYDVQADSVLMLIPNGVSGTYIPTGHIMYADAAGRLWVVDFDLESLSVGTDPTPVLDGLTLGFGVAAQFDVSDNGTLVYGAGGSSAAASQSRGLAVIDFNRNEESIPIAERVYRNVRWAPDGKSIAFSALEPGENEGATSMFVYDVELRTATRQLTFEGTQGWPVWSPDGQRIAFSGTRGEPAPGAGPLGSTANMDVWVMPVYGDADPEPLFDRDGSQFPYAWTAGGQILFTSDQDASSNLMFAEPGDEESIGTYLDIDEDLGAVAISPDGRFAAMASSESGDFEIVVRSFPRAGQPLRISQGGGDRPRWGPDGKSIYYWRGGAVDSLMVARLQTEPTLGVTTTETVLTGNFAVGTWDLHPDGDRIIIARDATGDAPAAEPVAERTLVVVNWFAELRARLGEGR